MNLLWFGLLIQGDKNHQLQVRRRSTGIRIETYRFNIARSNRNVKMQ